MKKSIPVLIAMVALLGVGYCIGYSHATTNVVNADETPRWIKVEFPLGVFQQQSSTPDSGYAWAEGFWQSTSTSKDSQLVWPFAVNVICRQTGMTCTVAGATVVSGLLKAQSGEYRISSWTADRVVANSTDGQLSLDFKANSVTLSPPVVTERAKGLSLQGGGLVLSPSAAWNPLEGPVGSTLPAGNLAPPPPGTSFPR